MRTSENDNYDEASLAFLSPALTKSPDKYRLWLSRNVLAHTLLCFLNILAILLIVSKVQQTKCSDTVSGPYSPASDAIQYKLETMDLGPGQFATGNPYVGDPRPELDRAWNELLENVHIWVTPFEFGKLYPQINRTSLRLPNGSYIIRLGVYHELHCLKWIRKWMHRDHYWPDLSGEALHERKWHIEHCLEHFRLVTMQRASLAPATLYFGQGAHRGQIEVNGAHVVHSVDWVRFQDWTTKRRVDLSAVEWSSLQYD